MTLIPKLKEYTVTCVYIRTKYLTEQNLYFVFLRQEHKANILSGQDSSSNPKLEPITFYD